MRGAERRALWLMCPIKLLQTLQRQLLPVGPWVQIGSVSLPRVVSAGPESGGQLSGHTAGLLPLANLGPLQPRRLCSLQYPSGLPGPARLLTVLDPCPKQPEGPSQASLSFSRNGCFMLCRGSSLRKPLSGHPTEPVPSLDNTSALITAGSCLGSTQDVLSSSCMCYRGGLLKLDPWGHTASLLFEPWHLHTCFSVPGASPSTLLASVSFSVKWV